jgi:hypothetical protein
MVEHYCSTRSAHRLAYLAVLTILLAAPVLAWSEPETPQGRRMAKGLGELAGLRFERSSGGAVPGVVNHYYSRRGVATVMLSEREGRLAGVIIVPRPAIYEGGKGLVALLFGLAHSALWDAAGLDDPDSDVVREVQALFAQVSKALDEKRPLEQQWRFIEVTAIPPATGTDPFIGLNVFKWPSGGTWTPPREESRQSWLGGTD